MISDIVIIAGLVALFVAGCVVMRRGNQRIRDIVPRMCMGHHDIVACEEECGAVLQLLAECGLVPPVPKQASRQLATRGDGEYYICSSDIRHRRREPPRLYYAIEMPDIANGNATIMHLRNYEQGTFIESIMLGGPFNEKRVYQYRVVGGCDVQSRELMDTLAKLQRAWPYLTFISIGCSWCVLGVDLSCGASRYLADELIAFRHQFVAILEGVTGRRRVVLATCNGDEVKS